MDYSDEPNEIPRVFIRERQEDQSSKEIEMNVMLLALKMEKGP